MKAFKNAIFFVLLSLIACTTGKKEPEIKPLDYDPNMYQIAFLISDGVYNTELTAPYDIFHHTIFRHNIKPMQVFTIAETTEMVTTFEGIRIKPDYSYLKGGYPPIDILVVPSAEHHIDTDLENEAMIEFVQKAGEKASFVCSHCDGSFVLAKAGLLENKTCTTFPADIPLLRKNFPEIDIRDSVLFVHDGNIITSAGGVKSFEASLYLTELLYGKGIADEIAKGLVIDWDLSKTEHLIISKK